MILQEAVRANLSFGTDCHQAIMNVAYELWTGNVQGRPEISYDQFIDRVANTYGDLAVLAVLTGKYNQQVENGGHSQYVDNGYAGWDGEDDLSLHEEMLILIEHFHLADSGLGRAVLENAAKLELDDVEDEDSGNTEWVVRNAAARDETYDSVSEKWMALLEEFFRKEIES
jgi:hypothetical protein